MDKISVIIPVYNVQDYLPRCLDSIINNTYRNLEIICINDGSPDKSLDILKDYARKDSRIVIIDKENGGVSNSRNVALEKATGDYISFVDSDDWVHNEYFEILLNGIKRLDADIAICSYEKKYDGDNSISAKSYLEYEFSLQKINPINPPHMLRSFVWGRIYRKQILNNKLFNENVSYMEDKDLSLSIICENKNLKVAEIKAPLYYYFIRESSASNTVNIPKTVDSLGYLLSRADDYLNDIQKAAYVNEALRYSLIIYNRAKKEKAKAEDVRLAKKLVRSCAKKMKTISAFSFKYKLIYGLFCAIPFLHRLLRDIKLFLKK